MSFLLTAALAQRAADRLEPMRVAAHAAGDLKRLDGHLVFLDATCPYDPDWQTWQSPLLEVSYGDDDMWGHDFRGHARSKADICWRTHRSTRDVIHLTPWLLEQSDTPWEGGIYRNGIVVAYSGGSGEQDEVMAETVLAWLKSYSYSYCSQAGLWSTSRGLIGSIPVDSVMEP